VPLLGRQGVRVATIDLPSCGSDPSRLADLEGDAAAVGALLDRIGGPALVVAHSYGGAPVTVVAADHGEVQKITYLCAFMLDVGESCDAIVGGTPPEWCQFRDDATFIIDPNAAAEVLYGDCDTRVQRRAITRLVPQLAVTSTQTLSSAAWHTVPSTYVVCTLDRALPPSTQRRLAERAGDTIELPTSHSPFFSRPEWLADVIIQNGLAERS
jgi:pimeloyl-ACP methyl ester carboxylesterase